MKYKRFEKYNMSIPAALLLTALFALCVMSVMLAGAGAFKRLTIADRQNFSARTCSQYIISRLRRASAPDAVSAGKFDASDCLFLDETIDGITYTTCIYCCDGWLCELFSEKNAEFRPQDGERLLEAQDLSLHLEDGLIHVAVTDGEGLTSGFVVNVRGMENKTP